MTAGLAYAPKFDRIPEIGLGGGVNSSYLHASLPEANILTVELEVVDLAKKYFRYQESDKQRVVVADGRAYPMCDAGGWDIISLNTYRRGFVPFHLVTK